MVDQEGTLYLVPALCSRLFVYTLRMESERGPFDMSPVAKTSKNKRGTSLFLRDPPTSPSPPLAPQTGRFASIEAAESRSQAAAART